MPVINGIAATKEISRLFLTIRKKRRYWILWICCKKVTLWVNTTSQNMGNRVTKEDILHKELAGVKIQPAPVSKGEIPLKAANEVLQNNRELVVIGFDVLQIPKYKMTLRMK